SYIGTTHKGISIQIREIETLRLNDPRRSPDAWNAKQRKKRRVGNRAATDEIDSIKGGWAQCVLGRKTQCRPRAWRERVIENANRYLGGVTKPSHCQFVDFARCECRTCHRAKGRVQALPATGLRCRIVN